MKQINIAPLIDVVFLLLIFFMLTSTFLIEETIDLLSPINEEETTKEYDENILRLIIDSGNNLYLNDVKVEYLNLKEKIKDIVLDGKKTSILKSISNEKRVNKLVEVLDKIRSAGLTNINLISLEN